jgi:hypothetical protein
MDDFERNIFVNCPFDDDYRQLLTAVVFAVKYLGFTPRLSLERSDSGETRIHKILQLIEESKFGIHDLSRIVSKDQNEYYRMNMPFELGIDYGCQKLKDGQWKDKRILILEKERYRYQAALSDLSGSDIKNHDDDPLIVTKAIRDWLVTEALNTGPSANKIWSEFNDFNAYLYSKAVEEEGHSSVDELPIPEVIHHIGSWLENR